MITDSGFKPAWWLTSSHAQTMFPALVRKIQVPVDKTERIVLPDGDFVDLSWVINGLPDSAPLMVVLHGLGGGIRSGYAAGLMHSLNKQGCRAVMMHLRGASDEPNRMARAYHSGDTADFNFVMNLLAERESTIPRAAIGFSLGGNVLLKWLGEQGSRAPLDAAVAVSVPFQLGRAADRMGHGFSRLYQAYLLNSLRDVLSKKRMAWKGDIPPALLDADKWDCFWTFDEHVTAPLNGFSSVHSYYRQSSSRAYLSSIQKPTLIIHALDDPFMTEDILPGPDELSSHVTLELSSKGGHVGFISGNIPGKPVYWLEQRIPDFIGSFVQRTQDRS
ncbi:hydrolase [Legionella sp. CNM-4043-24]|uniref:hydrolase n=1 Tax=Legionella sp. CNM-4043-24 TaxID=3421646 RepID=UPI00403AADDD